MGKIIARAVCALLLSLSAAMYVQAAQETEEIKIEQIDFNAPQVTVYGYGLEAAGLKPEALLGEEKLTPHTSQSFRESGEGISYYLLLDVSNSMPEDYFNKLKEGISLFYSELGANDTIHFITFGEEVLIRKEGAGTEEEIRALLDQIENKDKRTLLFEAVSQAVKKSQKQETANRRQVILAISDGEDVAVGKTMAQEALSELKEKNIPVYGLCLKDTARENINSFGEFARTSGGELFLFDSSKAGTVLSDVRAHLLSAWELGFEMDSNRITNRYESFSLYLEGQEQPVTSQVFSGRWIADTEPPILLTASQLNGRQLELTFSKAVTGYETASNYILKKDGAVIPIGAVAQSEGKENTVLLTTAEGFEAGAYTISCVNIHDNSQEQNPVQNVLPVTLEASDPVVEEMESSGGQIWILVSMAVLLVIFVLIVILFYRRLKKNRGLVFVEGKPIMASAVDIKQHVAIAEAEKKKFELLVTVAGKNPEKLELAIDRSMIVGRSNICDVFFDDSRMSRQHFALEWDGTDMYITDLDTTNGTAVNGVRIKGKRKLENGAQITAGAEDMRIRW